MTADPVVMAVSLGFAALIGLAMGSFLNVVIARTPRLIDEEASFAGILHGWSWPASHCMQCGHDLSWRDNIPVAAWLALRGKCRFCRQPYGARYVVVEALGAAIAIYAVATFGPTGQAALLALFGLGLLALVVIDLEEQLLPDIIVAPLALIGLVYQGLYGAGLVSGLAGAALGGGALWAIRFGYWAATRKEGMGLGDVKLAGMLGAWLGLAAIPPALFLAFFGGTAVMGGMILLGRMDRTAPTPFGPFLAGGALAVLAVPGLGPWLTALAGYG